MSVAIVDYGSGNLHSAAKAFERAARESGRDNRLLVTSDPDAVTPPSALCCRASVPLPIAAAGSTKFPAWSMRLNRACAKWPAVLRHLRRHAIDGGARPRIQSDAGSRLDRGRSRSHHAVRSGSENSAHGLEHAQCAESRIRCSTEYRWAPTDCMHISCTRTN